MVAPSRAEGYDATVLLVGQESGENRGTLEAHAERLRARGLELDVRLVTFEQEPERELSATFGSLQSDTVYVVPMCLAHTRVTTELLPDAFTHFTGEVRYCEPVGRHGAVTKAIRDRAAEALEPGQDVTLILASMGNTSAPHQRRATETHADRIRETAEYGAVRTAYLVQNPAVECARYTVSTDRAVTVPLFLTRGPATDEEIPRKLELDRGGMAYADPLGEHERITTAIESVVHTQRAIAGELPTTYEDSLTVTNRQMATDGDGR